MTPMSFLCGCVGKNEWSDNEMTANEYQTLAMRTLNPAMEKRDILIIIDHRSG